MVPEYHDDVYGRYLYLRWIVDVRGGADYQVIGSTVTDQLITDNHFTNQQYGVELYVYNTYGESTCPGAQGHYMKLTDDQISWESDKMTFTFPTSITCRYCGQEINLKNNWHYKLQYTTATAEKRVPSFETYKNQITIGEGGYIGSVSQLIGMGKTNVTKTGEVNPKNGTYDWTIEAQIPKSSEEGRYYAGWNLLDQYLLTDGEYQNIGPTKSEFIKNPEITIATGGNTYQVKEYSRAEEGDRFVYRIRSGQEGDRIYFGMKCECEDPANKCWQYHDASCDMKWENTGYCSCWTLDTDAVITIRYSTDDAADTILQYGDKDYYKYNHAYLNLYEPTDGNPNAGFNEDYRIADNYARIPVKSPISKSEIQIPSAENDCTARFQIQINSSHTDLSEAGEITIKDKMEDSLLYVPGSISVVTQTEGGQEAALEYGEDYTAEYDAESHELTIELDNIGRDSCTIVYETMIVNPSNSTVYSNSASITLFGRPYNSETEEKGLSSYSTSDAYNLTVKKVEKGTGNVLPGAEFGFYKYSDDTLVTKGETGEDGQYLFHTSSVQGNEIVFGQHTLYYLKEIHTPDPEKYQLDETKHYFYFCKNTNKCAECMALENQHGGLEIQRQKDIGGLMVLENEKIVEEEESTTREEESTTEEEESTTKAEETTPGEEESTTGEEESTTKAEETTPGEEESTTGAEETTAKAEETTTGEEVTEPLTTLPIETTKRPPKETTQKTTEADSKEKETTKKEKETTKKEKETKKKEKETTKKNLSSNIGENDSSTTGGADNILSDSDGNRGKDSKGGNPITGDSHAIHMWILMMICTATVVAAHVLGKRKRE